MSVWKHYERRRPLDAIPVDRRVESPCGRFVAAFYLVGEHSSEGAEGGAHEVAVYDTASGAIVACLSRSWSRNYRSNYTRGHQTHSVGFSADGDRLLINGGHGGSEADVPIAAALRAIDIAAEAQPEVAQRYAGGEREADFLDYVQRELAADIEYADLLDLAKERLGRHG
jgi:hypothetical protein